MSLRLRLTMGLGSAFIIIWSLAAAWMLHDLRNQMMTALDERLGASARMVAGLLEQLPQPLANDGTRKAISAERLGIPNGLACQVSSLRGEVLARSHDTPDQQLSAKRTGYHDQNINGVAWRSFTLPVGELLITTADRLDERNRLGTSVLVATTVPMLVALLGSLYLLWLSLKRGLDPLQKIRDALSRRSANSLEPLQLGSLPAELQPLVESQNQLFQRIALVLERERRFTGDAAHELRSPLTAIKTHIQVAQMTQGKAVADALASAEAGADRLQHTLEQLLLLAKVEGNLEFDDGAACWALQAAKQVVADLQINSNGRIQLETASLKDVELDMPVSLLMVALRNLLENALRHTPEDMAVQVKVTINRNYVDFSFYDKGPGLPPEKLEHITRRFWRGPGSNGSGLGLSIVCAIAERFDCHLHFNTLVTGTEASLKIPVR
ncbi:two-component sensor histidine kinase (plasmid) [Pseudomonas luteola]|uniref:ATP-binding protein n=1 Tax=Pseudomonas luteola TaxID=47886 RepID=UPI00388F3EFC